MVEHLADAVEAGAGNPRVVECADRIVDGELCHCLRDRDVDRLAVADPRDVGRELGIGGQVRPVEDIRRESRPLAIVLDAEDHLVPISGRVGVVRRDDGMRRAGPRWVLARVLGDVQRVTHPLDKRVEHRDLEGRGLTGAVPVDEGREDVAGGIHPGGDVGDRDAGLGRVVGCAGDGHEAGLALHEQVVGALVPERTGRAVAGHRAHDESRAAGAQQVGTETEPLDRARAEVVQEDVRLLEQPVEHVTAPSALEVEGHRLLAAVEPDEVAAQPTHRMVVAAGEVTAVGAFELDDPGAEVGQMPRGERRGHRLLDSADEHAVERQRSHACAGGSSGKTSGVTRRGRSSWVSRPITAAMTSAQKMRWVARYSECRMYSCTTGSRCPENAMDALSTECGTRAASRAGGFSSWLARVVLAMLPKTATPTALPSDRMNMLAPVTTPRRFQPTTDCTATRIAIDAKPSPTPTTKLDRATRHSPVSSCTNNANIKQPVIVKTLPISAVSRKSMRR